MQHLIDLAHAHGITVDYAPLDGRDGEYRHDLHRIRLRDGMSERLAQSTLAHELGHAAYGDEPTPFGPLHHRQERRADEWAALRLIRFADYREAELLHEGHLPSVAFELDVITRLVAAYRRVIARECPALVSREGS